MCTHRKFISFFYSSRKCFKRPSEKIITRQYSKEILVWVKARKSHSQFELSKYLGWKLLKKNPQSSDNGGSALWYIREEILRWFCFVFISADESMRNCLINLIYGLQKKCWFSGKRKNFQSEAFCLNFLLSALNPLFTTRLLLSVAISPSREGCFTKKLHFTATKILLFACQRARNENSFKIFFVFLAFWCSWWCHKQWWEICVIITTYRDIWHITKIYSMHIFLKIMSSLCFWIYRCDALLPKI